MVTDPTAFFLKRGTRLLSMKSKAGARQSSCSFWLSRLFSSWFLGKGLSFFILLGRYGGRVFFFLANVWRVFDLIYTSVDVKLFSNTALLEWQHSTSCKTEMAVKAKKMKAAEMGIQREMKEVPPVSARMVLIHPVWHLTNHLSQTPHSRLLWNPIEVSRLHLSHLLFCQQSQVEPTTLAKNSQCRQIM